MTTPTHSHQARTDEGGHVTLLQLVRDLWCIESRHLLPDPQHHENDYRYGGPGAAVLATLRTLSLNLLALRGHHSVRAGLAVVAHDIAKMLAMAGIRPDGRLDQTLNQPCE